jgi:hypothetical protein
MIIGSGGIRVGKKLTKDSISFVIWLQVPIEQPQLFLNVEDTLSTSCEMLSINSVHIQKMLRGFNGNLEAGQGTDF